MQNNSETVLPKNQMIFLDIFCKLYTKQPEKALKEKYKRDPLSLVLLFGFIYINI